MPSGTDTLTLAWRCKCPRCQTGDLYEPGLTMDLRAQCPDCDLDLDKCDAADGPAVFLIFILGFLLVPLALIAEFTLHPPLWAHALVWGTLALLITLGLLRPVKAFVIALQFKHRPEMFE